MAQTSSLLCWRTENGTKLCTTRSVLENEIGPIFTWIEPIVDTMTCFPSSHLGNFPRNTIFFSSQIGGKSEFLISIIDSSGLSHKCWQFEMEFTTKRWSFRAKSTQVLIHQTKAQGSLRMDNEVIRLIAQVQFGAFLIRNLAMGLFPLLTLLRTVSSFTTSNNKIMISSSPDRITCEKLRFGCTQQGEKSLRKEIWCHESEIGSKCPVKWP